MDIQKDIWMYWHQGWSEAPEAVMRCFHSVNSHNQDWNIHQLDWKQVGNYCDMRTIEEIRSNKEMSLTGLSDLIRLSLLRNHGGVWVDGTVLCLRPINDWLDQEKTFFAFSNPGHDRLLSTWFLAAQKDASIIDKWLNTALEYWQERKWHRPYYWCHNLFKNLYHKDSNFRATWDDRQDIPADGPHYMTPYKKKFFELATSERKADLKDEDLPLLKLTYKCLGNGYSKGTMIDYILNDMQYH